MNSSIQPGDIVIPNHCAIPPWLATVKRVVGGKALVAITEVDIGRDLVRRCTPPLLSWVELGWLKQVRDDEECSHDPIEQRGSKTHNRNY